MSGFDLRGKGTVVTGAGSGIGRAICVALAEHGARVVAADIDGERAAAVADEIGGVGIGADVSTEAAVEKLADDSWEALGTVDAVFNNAGVNGGTWLLDSTDADLRWLFSVNVFGVFYGCKVFGRRFRDQGTPAWICNTGSEHSFGLPHIQGGIYNATKHAVMGLSDTLRSELPPHIGISILCPGVVRTDFWQAARTRPDEFGGAAEGMPEVRAIMERGMDPAEIGRRCVEGVERGDFIVVTHSHARTYADKRHAEITAAFDAQAPRTEGDDRYDVTSIALEVAAHLAEQK